MKYADDTTICFPIFREKSNNHISSQHARLLKWSSDMDLKVNENKCKALIIKKSPNCEVVQLQGVQYVESMKILGITFNTRGTWSSHVNCERHYCTSIKAPLCSPIIASIALSQRTGSSLQCIGTVNHGILRSFVLGTHCGRQSMFKEGTKPI